MRAIRNNNLAQLLAQLRFAPQAQRQKQLEATEKLFTIIEPQQDYPYEFICYQITGYRPKGPERQELVKGSELADDLQIFITKLSAQLAQPTCELNQKVYSIAQLAKHLTVSTKTIHRWRKRGLPARKFIFGNGKKQLGLLQSNIDEFAKKNPGLLRSAKKFTRLGEGQEKEIVKRAYDLAQRGHPSRRAVIGTIAGQLGRAHETVRYTLVKYEKAHPDKPIFKKPNGMITPKQAVSLYEMYENNVELEELKKKFHRSKSSIYRIIKQRRAKQLLSKKIEFIDSDEFLSESAKQEILGKALPRQRRIAQPVLKPLKSPKESLSQYLEAIKRSALLNRAEESELFRRYNFLKYSACLVRAKIRPTKVTSTQLSQIEGHLTEAEQLKKRLIESNLRLVVSIANKHVQSGFGLGDLISIGNLALMRAVEKFDYTLGYRFSTYASLAIAKDYARRIPAEAGRPDRASAIELANIPRDMRTTGAADIIAVEKAHKSLVEVIKNNLDQREQHIILNHFGLINSIGKKKTKSLRQIGEELSLSKERVRQIELVALQKLRHCLSIEEFELLTK